MFSDFIFLFESGKATKKDIVELWFTDIGSSLYAYMVMLGQQGRKQESNLMENLRTEIFALRTRFDDRGFEIGTECASEMYKIAAQFETIRVMLSHYHPHEAGIFQSPTNSAIGLANYLKKNGV